MISITILLISAGLTVAVFTYLLSVINEIERNAVSLEKKVNNLRVELEAIKIELDKIKLNKLKALKPVKSTKK